jgi:hypothetical protein
MLWILLTALTGLAQIDPIPRNLIQFGYNQPVAGNAPFAAYGFYYHNNPYFHGTNIALRAVIAPVYMDSELGVRNWLGPKTDLGIGLAGGGFAFNHAEIRRGQWIKRESFTGHGGEISTSIYHNFNPLPTDREPDSLADVPLQLVLRGGFNFSLFTRNSSTARDFVIPEDLPSGFVRVGLRWGGREPRVKPPTAVEASVWYQGMFRTQSGLYGFDEDRRVESVTHMVLARTLFAYTLEESQQRLEVSVTGGAMYQADRLNVFRLGGTLPLVAEFPLMLPGYYLEELSAQRFGVLHAVYSAPITPQWEILAHAGTAVVDYLPELSQPGRWNSGVGGGLAWKSASGRWQIVTTYAYGLQAMRTSGRGAHNVGILVQVDLDRKTVRDDSEREVSEDWIRRVNPVSWRGFQRFFR